MSPMLENDHGLAVRAVSTTFNQVVLCPLRLPFSLPSICLSVCLSVRNLAALRQSEKGRTTAADPSN